MTKDNLKVLMSGLAFGESPRWHDGRLWFSDWGAQQIIAVDPHGESEVMVRLPFATFPFSIDWLPRSPIDCLVQRSTVVTSGGRGLASATR